MPGPLTRLWHAYEHQLEVRPILTQSLTSGALWGVGDVLAQRLAAARPNQQQQQKPQQQQTCTVDPRRSLLTSLFGGAFIGPIGECGLYCRQCQRFSLSSSCCCFVTRNL
jgi:hypothetical protein